ncbi:hypothetical protein IW140_002616 [Coemansia sp. RSA 1813]|nr:hypothetical protein LPJ74_001211 [Coemansia sp. RSA 1843]KAJ2216159.1 hypothetical protein EV179_001619 [Coemansia sp. RSA 487]KAJ2570146.1 hypothetical protein IW140_002616 [Coemansia sp. RSA 1813]
MKLTSAFVVLAAIAGVDALTPCSRVATRKEVRSLSSAEWSTTSRVVTQMNNNGWFAWFAYLHTQNFNIIHNCEMFFPFHRRFIRDFEEVGQRFDSSFVLPYWDEVRDYANPSGSAVLSSSYLGGNGQSGSKCVTNGVQSSWTMTYPSNHCLNRQYNNGNTISPMYSPEYIQSLLTRSTKMSQLRPAIENSLHGLVHLSLGGDMTQTYSPNDFAFWVHHANIDRIWFVWQMENPQNNFWSMDGSTADGKAIGYGTPVTHYGDAIIDVMYPTMNNMCFTYDNVMSVGKTTKRSVGTKRDVQKCIPRPSANGNDSSGGLPALVDGVFDNVNDILTDAETYVKSTILQQLPSNMLNKWFPALQSSASNNTQADIPEPPVVAESKPTAPAYTGQTAPAIPSDGNDLAGHNYGTDYSYAEETDTSDYNEATIPVSSAPYDSSAETDIEEETSGSAAEESNAGQGTATADYSAAVSVPTHVGGNTFNEAEAETYSVDYVAYDLSDDSGLDGAGPKYPMPVPAPYSIGFIKMHGYSVNEISQNYALAKQFVADMNAAKYQSPYAKVAQNVLSDLTSAADGVVSDVANGVGGVVSDVVNAAGGVVSDVANGVAGVVSDLL